MTVAQPVPVREDFHTARAIMLAAVAALGGFLFGYDTAVINGAVTAVENEFDMSKLTIGFAVSSALLGCMAGALVAGMLADRIGRIKVMLMASALFTVSALGSGLAFGTWDLIFWRIVGGLGVGAASVIAPAYIAEISPASIRGRLGSLQQLAIVFGIFIALLSNYALAESAGGAAEELAWGMPAWRWMFLCELLPAVAYGVLALRIPESPRYLVKQGMTDKARDALRFVLKSGIDDRIVEIARSMASETKSTFADLRGHAAGLQPIVLVGIMLSVFQQFVGINVVFYYSASLWQQVGFDESKALAVTVITSITNIAVTLVAISLIDKIGRRVLLLVGSGGMALSLAALAFVFGTAPVVGNDPVLSDSAGLVALVALNAFVVFFGMSWGPAVWVLLGEMFPNRLRAAALGVAASAQWLANFVISTSFPSLAEVSLALAYGLYTTFAVLSFFFVLKFVPHTTGRQLEDMDDQLERT